MDTFTIILDNLTRHGVPDALERANEIEAEMNYKPKRKDIDIEAHFILNRIVLVFGMDYIPRKFNNIWGDHRFGVGESARITMDAVKGTSRVGELTLIRHLLMFLLIKQGYSLSNIGVYLKRDHSSVINARQRIQDRLDVDKKFQDKFKDLRI